MLPLMAAIAAAITITGCGQPAPTPAPPPASVPPAPVPSPAPGASSEATFVAGTLVDLNGAGATFPAPLYTKWFDEYNKITGSKINYQAIGSGGGIAQITAGTVDFGASDGIMTDAQIAAASSKGGPILHIPMTSGSVAVIYNITKPGTGNVTGLKLTPDVLADIYLKKITNWTDGRIAALNPEMQLPSMPIAVVHRADGSGTTNIFTNYLSKVSEEWKTKVGNANSVAWPGDIGGQGNAGVAGQVAQIEGGIGYVELAYAVQNKLPYASLKNAAGNYIAPSLESTTAAAQGVSLPDDMKVMLTDSSNPDAYPIAGFTWLLVYVNQTDKDKGVSLAKMLWWAVHDGQEFAPGIGYAPLSDTAVAKAEAEILSIMYNGQAIATR